MTRGLTLRPSLRSVRKNPRRRNGFKLTPKRSSGSSRPRSRFLASFKKVNNLVVMAVVFMAKSRVMLCDILSRDFKLAVQVQLQNLSDTVEVQRRTLILR